MKPSQPLKDPFNSTKKALALLSFSVLLLLGIFGLSLSNNFIGNIDASSLMALVKKGIHSKSINTVQRNTTKLKSPTINTNVFSRPKESYLSITSPFYNFLSKLVNPEPLKPQDLLSITKQI